MAKSPKTPKPTKAKADRVDSWHRATLAKDLLLSGCTLTHETRTALERAVVGYASKA